MHSAEAADLAPLGVSPAPPDNHEAGKSSRTLLGLVTGVAAQQCLPSATYRLQLNAGMTFRKATALIPYFEKLGISHLYTSPLFKAQPGSQHGYDVVDYCAINPELGSLCDLRDFARELHSRQMGLIVDIVPNHMSATPDNLWWRDVLENGPGSEYANFFDIDWMPLKPDLAYKVLLPVLDDQFGKILEEGALSVHFHDGEFWLRYHGSRFPLALRSYTSILDTGVESLAKQLGHAHAGLQELMSILTAIRNLPPWKDSRRTRVEERRRETTVIKRRLQQLAERIPEIAGFIDSELRSLNGRRGQPCTFDRLDALLKEQSYRLAYWRVAADEINFRRFFDVNELAAICMESDEVFRAAHRLLFDLIDEGLIDGLRIDHLDGMYDPSGYLWKLQEGRLRQLCAKVATNAVNLPNDMAARDLWAHVQSQMGALREHDPAAASQLARPIYIIVEKILAQGEEPPSDWPVHGTVGYEFLSVVNGLFVDSAAEGETSTTYERFTGESLDFDELAYFCKRLVVRLSMASELSVLGHQLDRISERNRWTRDFTLNSLTRALQEVTAFFSVYRTYIGHGRVAACDRAVVESAVENAKRRNPAMSASVFDFVRDVLLLNFAENSDDQEREAERRFVGKFQQLTGPIMAKAVEDTAFYRFNRLISLNEVGGDPRRFGAKVAELHDMNCRRASKATRGLSCTSTHDTKRSEDLRARIHVLSEVPMQWREHVNRWAKWNARHKRRVETQSAPSPNLEYLFYQTLVGMWPVTHPTSGEHAALVPRLHEYLLKVAREAKTHTSWVNRHAGYEHAVMSFVETVMRANSHSEFLQDVDCFAHKVAEHGVWNALSATFVKVTSPGVPDFYQGTESWSLSLVDPDNRRHVEFSALRRRLDAIQTTLNKGRDFRASLLNDLLARRHDGDIKMLTTMTGLSARRSFPELFAVGEYIPIESRGKYSDCVVAFARRLEERVAVVVAPRLTARLVGFGGPPPIGSIWRDTCIVLPKNLSIQGYRDMFTDEQVEMVCGEIPLSLLLRQFPLSLTAPV